MAIHLEASPQYEGEELEKHIKTMRLPTKEDDDTRSSSAEASQSQNETSNSSIREEDIKTA